MIKIIKITDAELKVMNIFWSKGQANSLDIIKELRKEAWSENTIRTLVKRLLNKNAIEIVEKNKKIYTYKPIISENGYKLVESNALLNKLYNGSISEMLLNFVKHDKLSKEDLESLIKKIDSIK